MFKHPSKTQNAVNNLESKMKHFTLIVMISLLSLPVFAENTNDNFNRWVEVADGFRQNAQNLKVNTRVRQFKNGQLQKEKLYEVYIRPERKSLVLFQSSGEQGQKVLMIADKFWMIMPKSRRPIRITPMQKLLGEASTGDIATMSWHEDYEAKLEGEQELDGRKLNVLNLTASTKGVSYKTIRLFLEPGSHKPIKAELYVSSGKLAKHADFVISHNGDREEVSKMVLTDAIQKGRVTEVEYLTSQPYSLSSKYYNPQYLAKNRSITVK